MSTDRSNITGTENSTSTKTNSKDSTEMKTSKTERTSGEEEFAEPSDTNSEYQLDSLNNLMSCLPFVKAFNAADCKKKGPDPGLSTETTSLSVEKLGKERRKSLEMLKAVTKKSTEDEDFADVNESVSEYHLEGLNNMVSCLPVVKAFNTAETKRKSSGSGLSTEKTGFSKEIVLDKLTSAETAAALVRPSSEVDDSALQRPASNRSEYEMKQLNGTIAPLPVCKAFSKAELKKNDTSSPPPAGTASRTFSKEISLDKKTSSEVAQALSRPSAETDEEELRPAGFRRSEYEMDRLNRYVSKLNVTQAFNAAEKKKQEK